MLLKIKIKSLRVVFSSVNLAMSGTNELTEANNAQIPIATSNEADEFSPANIKVSTTYPLSCWLKLSRWFIEEI